MLSSRDGFCTIIVLDEHLPAYHTQQQTLQLQSLVHAIGHPHAPAVSAGSTHPSSLTPMSSQTAFPQPLSRKRSEPPAVSITVSASSEELAAGAASNAEDTRGERQSQDLEPPKKKRRIALTRVDA
jgi:chromatin assembly factor 1 subunit B